MNHIYLIGLVVLKRLSFQSQKYAMPRYCWCKTYITFFTPLLIFNAYTDVTKKIWTCSVVITPLLRARVRVHSRFMMKQFTDGVLLSTYFP